MAAGGKKGSSSPDPTLGLMAFPSTFLSKYFPNGRLRHRPGGPPDPPGKRLRRYAYGLDRTNRCPKLTSKRHTDLRSCVSEAKIIKESDFDVKSCLAPPKSTEIYEKLTNPSTKKYKFQISIWPRLGPCQCRAVPPS